MDPWPTTPEALERAQLELAAARPPPWRPDRSPGRVAACFVCFERGEGGPGAAGDRGWAAAVLLIGGRLVEAVTVRGEAGAGYVPGLLALREGPLLEAAVRRLATPPELLFVNAVGRDHPRRAGMALHLGARLGVPSVGLTHRPLVAGGELPPDEPGGRSPLCIGREVVGYWLRTRPGTRPLAVHAAWRTDAETALELVLAHGGRWRTPAALRQARKAARLARAADTATAG